MKELANSTITPMVDPKWRFLSAALGLFGFLAAGPNAFATWHAANTGEEMVPLASIPAGGTGVTVFATDSHGVLNELWYWGGKWNSYPIYNQNAAALTASAVYVQSPVSPTLNLYYIAHLDADGEVRLTSWDHINGWKTQFVDTGFLWNPSGYEQMAALMFQGTLYIFYTGGSANTPYPLLKYAMYDGNVLTTKNLDGVEAAPGGTASSMGTPTAVAAPDGLHVYYYDYWNGVLREAFSPDGVNWTRFMVIDGGPSQYPVGYLPSAIVYSNGATWSINVFYTQMVDSKLRIAQIYPGIGNIPGIAYFGTVDDINLSSNKAVLLHDGKIFAYYVSPAGQIRVAWGAGPGALFTAALDGTGPGDLTNGNGSVQDPIGPPVFGVEVNGVGPSVFYLDITFGSLRNAYWK